MIIELIIDHIHKKNSAHTLGSKATPPSIHLPPNENIKYHFLG